MLLLDKHGHLVSDLDVAELHEICRLIGIPRRRFHGLRKGHPHYDLTTTRLKTKALVWGRARIVSPQELVQRMARR